MQKVNRLKEILNERSLTNSWLARQLDVNPATVSKWCTTSLQLDILTFLKIASLLHLDVNALYDEKIFIDISRGRETCEL
jgi:DNA-binding XRE family transcriptional regulator